MTERTNLLLKFVDLEGAITSTGIPSLKAIFDNLRNYPILALFYLVSREITQLPFPIAIAFHYFLVALLTLLSLTIFAQTALLLTSLAMGLLIQYLPARLQPALKKYKWWFVLVFTNFLFFCFFLAVSISMVIDKVKLNG